MSQYMVGRLTRHINTLSVYACAQDSLIHKTIELFESLSREGLSPSPLLTYELLCALTSQPAQRDNKRQRAQELRERYRELSDSLKPRPKLDEERIVFALRALFLEAPKVKELHSLIELESVALTNKKTLDDPWVEWRRQTELGILSLTSYRWHLMYNCLLKERPLGLSLLDDTALKIINMTRDQLERLNVKARIGLGDDDQRFRSEAGSFFESGFDTMPSDPTRILASDLSLFSEKSPATRAALLMKISDSSLSVRFGEVQRPARRKARVRIMVMLSDQLEHHVYGALYADPLIDSLRQVACHLIPNLFRLIKQTEVHGEVHLIRSGIFGEGSLICGELSADLHDYPAYRSSQSTVRELMLSAPWFFEDYPSRASGEHTSSIPLNGSDEDALIGVWLGGPPSWLTGYPLNQEIGLEISQGRAQVHTYATHTSKRAVVDVLKQITRDGYLDAHAIAEILFQQLDLSTGEASREHMMSNPWEGTTI